MPPENAHTPDDRIEHAIADAARHVRRCLETGFSGPPEEQPDPAANSALLKATARRLGADLVGICRLNPDHLFPGTSQGGDGEIPEGCDWVAVMAVAMDADAVRCSPGAAAATATTLGYVRAATCSSALGLFIRALGYRAISVTNGLALSPPARRRRRPRRNGSKRNAHHRRVRPVRALVQSRHRSPARS